MASEACNSLKFIPEPKNLNNPQFLSSGCPILDSFLRGGFPTYGITQIYGASGCGKTQIGLQLCLSAQIAQKQGAVYICTEDLFPSKRLQELLLKSPIAKRYEISSDLIFIEHISTAADFEECVLNKLPRLLATGKIKLLVIDSIAAPYRMDYDEKKRQDRAKSLRAIGHRLHEFSYKYNMSVVCINQVSASLDDKNLSDNIGSLAEKPSLGISWNSLVTNSFYIHRIVNERYFTTMGSPFLPRKTIRFEILDVGVVGQI